MHRRPWYSHAFRCTSLCTDLYTKETHILRKNYNKFIVLSALSAYLKKKSSLLGLIYESETGAPFTHFIWWLTATLARDVSLDVSTCTHLESLECCWEQQWVFASPQWPQTLLGCLAVCKESWFRPQRRGRHVWACSAAATTAHSKRLSWVESTWRWPRNAAN